jgi:hypothetical protein
MPLSQITTEKKHGVLQPNPLNGNLILRFVIKSKRGEFTYEFDSEESLGIWCLKIARSPM